MLNIKLIGKNLGDIRPLLEERGFLPDSESPELIIAHGGDGTMLQAEREFPGIPKFPIRDERTAPRCECHSYARQLDDLCAGRLSRTFLKKISASINGQTLVALNDVFVHNFDRGSALRYRVRIDGELYAHEIVGDGVGLATPHGSTAYYRSITHSIFRVGLGLAFSNSTEEVSHLVLGEDSVVEVEIVRGPGLVVADNNPRQLRVEDGDVITFRQIPETAEILGLGDFMCAKCRALRHPNKLPFKGYF